MRCAYCKDIIIVGDRRRCWDAGADKCFCSGRCLTLYNVRQNKRNMRELEKLKQQSLLKWREK